MVYDINCTKPNGEEGKVLMELSLPQLQVVQWLKNYGYLPTNFSIKEAEIIEP